MTASFSQAAFETHRTLLFGVAYRMLGSVQDAEDVVQDAWLRWSAGQREAVTSQKAYLIRVVTNLCTDRLRSSSRRDYLGTWLPEPLVTQAPVDVESVSYALLVLLETLSPLERAVFVLHRFYELSHQEVGAALGRSEAAVRQALHRAEAHVRERRPRFARNRASHALILERFVRAVLDGDEQGLRELLVKDVVAMGDGAGRGASPEPLEGVDAVTRLFLSLNARFAEAKPEFLDLNGEPGVLFRLGNRPAATLCIETDGQHIFRVFMVLTPAKLGTFSASAKVNV